MVSTRGIKVKYSEGERVLCYEPDPSKAKVLYDSKVLQVIQDKEKGRKPIEYLIHFQGWSASWDRRVTEDFVLKDTEENRELQKQLAEKSHIKLSIKSNRVLIGPGSSCSRRKRQRRLSETIRETIERERKSKAESDTSSKTGGTTEDDMASLSSEIGGSTGNEDDDEENEAEEEKKDEDLSDEEETIAKDYPITIPDPLKNILVKDYYQINEKNKLVNLPSEMPILNILEDYVKFFAVRYLARSSEKRKSEVKEKDKCFLTLDLCKEFVDGVRICFDNYVHTLLLYTKEKPQAEKMKKATPIKVEKKAVEVSINSLGGETTSAKDPPDEKESKNLPKEEKKVVDATPRRVLRSKKVVSEEVPPAPAPPQQPPPTPAAAVAATATAAASEVGKNQQPLVSCESGRSTPSTVTSCTSAIGSLSFNSADGELPLHLDSISRDFRSFTLLPEAFRNPPPPVLIYGSVHLLRLLVKMPEILYKMNLSPERKKIILYHMDMFLEYLNVHSQPFFSELNYVNNSEI